MLDLLVPSSLSVKRLVGAGMNAAWGLRFRLRVSA